MRVGDELIAVTPGTRMPGIPAQSLELNASYALNERWRVGIQFVAYSSIFVRGNENTTNRAPTRT